MVALPRICYAAAGQKSFTRAAVPYLAKLAQCSDETVRAAAFEQLLERAEDSQDPDLRSWNYADAVAQRYLEFTFLEPEEASE